MDESHEQHEDRAWDCWVDSLGPSSAEPAHARRMKKEEAYYQCLLTLVKSIHRVQNAKLDAQFIRCIRYSGIVTDLAYWISK